MFKSMTVATKRNRRREAIINAARQVFLESGYAATSMSGIAARLGGSKGTLYNYFGNKEELFEALVRDFCTRWADGMLAGIVEGYPAERLTAFAEPYLTHLFSEEGVKLIRVLVSESHRNPQFSRIFYEVGPVRGRERLKTYLEACKAQGLINAPNCALAAVQFLALCRGSTYLELLLNLTLPATFTEIHAQAAQAVGTFMRLYGVPSSAGVWRQPPPYRCVFSRFRAETCGWFCGTRILHRALVEEGMGPKGRVSKGRVSNGRVSVYTEQKDGSNR
jgi:AcrR family transcriptional regulator